MRLGSVLSEGHRALLRHGPASCDRILLRSSFHGFHRSRPMRGLDQLSLVGECHLPLHRVRTGGGIVKADDFHSLRLHLHIHRRCECRNGLVRRRLRVHRSQLRPRTRQRRIAQGVPKPVGVRRFGVFCANVIESRNRQCIDRRRREKRVSTPENGNYSDPAISIARNRRRKH